MYIKRALSQKLKRYARQYPIVTLTGPRQSGKSTLCTALFKGKPMVSFEDLDVRGRATRDPRSFLEQFEKTGAVFDEIQRVPSLFSYLQTLVDQKKKEGQFILTGSQNFQLLEKISQSLAGRTALSVLLPFSYSEISTRLRSKRLDEILFTGFYPRIFDKKLNPTEALSFYVSTYLERDIRQLVNVHDLHAFETFLKLCAARTGQILNLSSLASDCGINHNTAKNWLSVLETSYIVTLLKPHTKNFGKRLIKAPKLYFIDTGLACYLLDILKVDHLKNHPLRGALFETFVVSELLKERYHSGEIKSHLYYFRDNNGNEVDVLLDKGADGVCPIEIKSSKTIHSEFYKGIHFYKKINSKSARQGFLVYGGDHSFTENKIKAIDFRKISQIFKS